MENVTILDWRWVFSRPVKRSSNRSLTHTHITYDWSLLPKSDPKQISLLHIFLHRYSSGAFTTTCTYTTKNVILHLRFSLQKNEVFVEHTQTQFLLKISNHIQQPLKTDNHQQLLSIVKLVFVLIPKHQFILLFKICFICNQLFAKFLNNIIIRFISKLKNF